MRLPFIGFVLFTVAAAACSDQRGGSSGIGTTSSSIDTANSLSTGAPTPMGHPTRAPIHIDAAGARALFKNVRYERHNGMSADSMASLHQQQLHSVPYFAGSYSLGGTTYPYTMVGQEPRRGGTTVVNTSLLPVSLVFDEFADANGNPIVMDATPDIQPVLTGPDFAPAQYGTGFTQFADAVQRAEYWNMMRPDWHTVVGIPRMMKGITIEVPVGASQLYQAPDGVYFTLLDANFFYSQVNTIAQLADFHWNELAIMLTPGVFLYEGSTSNCCILGFHTAWDAQNPEGIADTGPERYAQTFAWASWIEPGLFGPAFADVTGLSHEMSEWTNDPFVDNTTENWAFPGSNGQQCQNNLETGDPVEVTPTPGYPVTLHGFTYHPQTEALLQWFEQVVPSNAIDGAYSYPDETALTGPSTDCSVDAGPPPGAGDDGGSD